MAEKLQDCVAEDSQSELMVRFHFETALQGKAPEKNRPVTDYPDFLGKASYSDARVIGLFWAPKLAFSLETDSEKII